RRIFRRQLQDFLILPQGSLEIPLAHETLDAAQMRTAFLFGQEHSDRRAGAKYENDQAGSTKTKVLPRPASLSTQTLPPCACTMYLTMARPNPVPGILRGPSGEAWRNFSKIDPACSFGIPGPVSMTETCTSSFARRIRTRTDPPRGVNLRAL